MTPSELIKKEAMMGVCDNCGRPWLGKYAEVPQNICNRCQEIGGPDRYDEDGVESY